MPLGTEVGVGLGHIMLNADTAPCPQKGAAAPPSFQPSPLWPNGLMDQDGTWYGSRPPPGDTVLDGDAAPPRP